MRLELSQALRNGRRMPKYVLHDTPATWAAKRTSLIARVPSILRHRRLSRVLALALAAQQHSCGEACAVRVVAEPDRQGQVGKADWQVVLVLGSGIAVSYYGREASKGRLLLSMLAVTAQKNFGSLLPYSEFFTEIVFQNSSQEAPHEECAFASYSGTDC